MLPEIHRYTWTGTNRHEVRVYESPDGRRFILDRTLDGVPPFFRLTENRGEPRRPTLRVQGHDYWGDGWEWEQAVAAAGEAIAHEKSPDPPGRQCPGLQRSDISRTTPQPSPKRSPRKKEKTA